MRERCSPNFPTSLNTQSVADSTGSQRQHIGAGAGVFQFPGSSLQWGLGVAEAAARSVESHRQEHKERH